MDRRRICKFSLRVYIWTSILKSRSVHYVLDPVWADKLNKGEITEEYVNQAFRNFNNVVKEIRMVLKVVK